MKKLISLVMVLSLMATCVASCSPAVESPEALTIVLEIDNPDMVVNGVKKEIDPGRGTVPVLIDGRTLLPVRAIVEEMGGTVEWAEERQEATLQLGVQEIRLAIGSATAYLNGEPHTLDTAPAQIGDRTFLPIRFVAEHFGFAVGWDPGRSEITITNQALEPGQEPIAPPEEEQMKNTLVVYFSRTGSTETLAEKIHALTGGDVARIVPAVPYSEDYDECLRQAQGELQSGDRPKIHALGLHMEQYETVILGYPIWFGQVPPPIATFLSEYDLSNKIIMPFCTSGSSGIDGSLSKIRELCPDSTVAAGFRGTQVTAVEDIDSWLAECGFVKPGTGQTPDGAEAGEQKIRLLSEAGEVIITMYDNPVSNNFVSMLPLRLSFSDFNETEKISYLPKPLPTEGASFGLAPAAGDFALYVPWGNLAVFYGDAAYSDDLVVLGRVDSGLNIVSVMDGEVTAGLVDN